MRGFEPAEVSAHHCWSSASMSAWDSPAFLAFCAFTASTIVGSLIQPRIWPSTSSFTGASISAAPTSAGAAAAMSATAVAAASVVLSMGTILLSEVAVVTGASAGRAGAS